MIDLEFNRKRKQHIVYKTIFIVGGLLFLVPGILKIIYRDTIEFDTDFFISAFNILVGLAWLLHGLNIINLSERSVIKIDKNSLYFNPSLFDKSTSIDWREIESVEIRVNKLIVLLKSRESREVQLGWIPYNDLLVIKEEIEKLSGEKSINCKRI